MPTPRKVKGARVLITGASSGLGALLATEMATRGASDITLWGRDADRLEMVATRLELLGCRVRADQVDLAEPGQVTQAGERTLAATGGIDICVNSAGVVNGRPFLELTEEQVTQVFEVNTLALYRTTRIVLPGMIERDRGVIVNISSAAGLTGAPKLSDYAASKFAAIGFTQSLRAELRKQGSDVRTLIVCPYHVHTGMFEGARSKVPLLLPSLDPIRVARQVVDAIEAGRRRLVLPPIMTAVLAVRMLPPEWSDPIVDLFGVGSLMDDFVGRR